MPNEILHEVPPVNTSLAEALEAVRAVRAQVHGLHILAKALGQAAERHDKVVDLTDITWGFDYLTGAVEATAEHAEKLVEQLRK